MLEISSDWVEAWAAVAAAVFTTGALLWQVKVQRMDRSTHRAEAAQVELEARAAAAARAHAIVVSTDETGVRASTSQVWNYSDEPVTQLRAEVHLCGSSAELRGDELQIADFLAPRTGSEVPLPVSFTNGTDGMTSAHVDIRFDDLHGNTWRRCGDEVILIRRPDADRGGRGQ